MIKITDTLKKTADDVVNKVFADQRIRTARSAANISSSLKNGVDLSAVTAQVNANVKKNNPDTQVRFTDEKILVIADFYDANKSRPVLTNKQTKSLIKLAGEEGALGALTA